MMAASTVVAIGSIRATPLWTRGSEGMLETLSAMGLADACLVGGERLALAARTRRGWHRLRQGSGKPVIDDQHRFELRQLDIGFDSRSAPVDRRDDAHRQT